MKSPINQRQATPGIRPLWSWLATLFLSARLWAGQDEVSPPDLVAVTTDLPEPAAITHYDISLRTDLDRNTLHLQTTCTVRNQSGQALTQVDFDLLAAEQSYGANVAIAGISATNDRARVACQFSHAPLEKPGNPDLAGTRQFPRIVRVKLPSPLPPDAECRLHFDYAITIPDLANDLNYGLIDHSPTGGKEVCLLSDYAWIPKVALDAARLSSLFGRNFFPKGLKSTWRISLAHPAALESLVPDGRLDGTERVEGATVVTLQFRCLASRTDGFPS